MTLQDKIEGSVPVKYLSDNFREPLARMRGEFGNLVDDFWSRPLGHNLTRRIQSLAGPALEFKDKESEYELIAEIPGMKAEEIELKITGNMLRLSGEKQEEREEKEDGFLFSKRSYGRFERVVELPEGIDHQKISATARDGILSVHLPKSPAAIERERKIPISA